MTLIYVGLILNFAVMVGSWFLFLKILRLKGLDTHLELENIKSDLELVARNPAAARRKLKSKQ